MVIVFGKGTQGIILSNYLNGILAWSQIYLMFFLFYLNLLNLIITSSFYMLLYAFNWSRMEMSYHLKLN